MAIWPFRAKCPVDDESRSWVDRRMKWLAEEFGMETWRTAKAVEPTEEFFPDKFDGTQETVRLMLDRVCGFMGVDPNRVELQYYREGAKAEISHTVHVATTGRGSAGHYIAGEKEIVGIEESKLGDPTMLVATIAHELAHVRLLGEKHLTVREEDHEPLTDLTTVFFGMGIFNANASFQFNQWSQGGWHGWKASTLGYLNESMFGYALGLWTFGRGEENPAWRKHLRVNPRTYMKQAVGFLRAEEKNARPEGRG
jgi:hypothetical protein